MPELIPVALENVYRLFNVGGTSLVSAAYEGKEDVMAATWVCPLNIVPSRVTACIDSTHYTRPLIEKSGMFALALPTMSIVETVLELGSVSRNDDDQKLEKSGAKFFKMPGFDMPFVEGCACYAVFKVLPEAHIEKAYDLFIGEAVAAPGLRRVDRHRAQRLAGHLSQLVAHVRREGTRVGDAHGHAFEFERHGPLALHLGHAFASRELLDGLDEGRGVRHGAVSGHRLGQAHLPQAVVRRLEGVLDAPVLVSQRDLEVQDPLAVADEAEGARFDDARMDRADVHLVQRPALHRVEGVVVDRAAAVAPVEGEAQRLGPRQAVEAHAVALHDVALEGVQLRMARRERRQRIRRVFFLL